MVSNQNFTHSFFEFYVEPCHANTHPMVFLL